MEAHSLTPGHIVKIADSSSFFNKHWGVFDLNAMGISFELTKAMCVSNLDTWIARLVFIDILRWYHQLAITMI